MNKLQKRIKELKDKVGEYNKKAWSSKEEDLQHETYRHLGKYMELELKGIKFAQEEILKMIDDFTLGDKWDNDAVCYVLRQLKKQIK